MENEKVYLLGFKVKEITEAQTEVLYPFGNFRAPNYTKFTIMVKSPSQYYYSDLFASFLLSPEEAWELYSLLLENQQVDDIKIDEKSILDKIPDHMDTLERQFKHYYSNAFYNVEKMVQKSPSIPQSPI